MHIALYYQYAILTQDIKSINFKNTLMVKENISVSEIETLSYKKLLKAGASEKQAAPLARAISIAEAEGIASHGLLYLPIYCLHLQCGKVVGEAEPDYTHVSGVMGCVDAQCGFAHSAIDVGFLHMLANVKENGMAAIAIRNSYNCGVLGYHTQRIAEQGYVGLGFTNAPASVAPFGGNKKVIGTNPFSLSVPGKDGDVAFCIDQSASVVAKSEVVKRAKRGETVPLGWVLDKEGNPTTDPEAGLLGTMVPSGEYKGFNIGLMVEVFAAALAGAHLGIEAAPFAGDVGGPPKTGQFFMAINPNCIETNAFASQIDRLCHAIDTQEGVRLPGYNRKVNRAKSMVHGVDVDAEFLQKIRDL